MDAGKMHARDAARDASRRASRARVMDVTLVFVGVFREARRRATERDATTTTTT